MANMYVFCCKKGESMNECNVTSFHEYVECVEEVSRKGFILSRGQKKDYPLLPSALRVDSDGKRLFSDTSVNKFIKDFERLSVAYLRNTDGLTEQDWKVYAQHFGVPTRLLDFTHSPLISLMFAVEEAFLMDDDGEFAVVWFLNPRELNALTINKMEISDIVSSKDDLDSASGPFVVSAKMRNERIAAQNGLFVYFKYNEPLNEVRDVDKFLIKVTIPHNKCKEMLVSLYNHGMRFNDLYPELTSISKDILLANSVSDYYKNEEMADE